MSSALNPTSARGLAPKQDLTAIVTDVLGELAFMVSDGASAVWPAGTVLMQGAVRYYGPITGTLRCWCTRSLATQLAANLLGIDVGSGGAQVAAEDAVREFLNVLCGHLVTARHGTSAVFNLDIPVVSESLEAPVVSEEPNDSICNLSIDGEPLLCTHELEGPAVS